MSKKTGKKGQKVDLDVFLADPGFRGDWADDYQEPVAAAAAQPTVGAAARSTTAVRLPAMTGLDAEMSARGFRQGVANRDDYPRGGMDRMGAGMGRGDYPSQGQQGPNGPGGGFMASNRPQAEIPDRAPFTAFVGNLPYDAAAQELDQLFAGCTITSTRLVDMEGRPRGFGYVEFADRQSLVDALSRNGQNFLGRTIRVDVAEAQRREGTIPEGGWRRAGAAGGNAGGNARDGDHSTGNTSGFTPSKFATPSTDGWTRRPGVEDRNSSRMGPGGAVDSDGRATMADFRRPEPRPGTGPRKKLELKPRTKPIEDQNTADFAPETTAAPAEKHKPNPFGAAVPRDENEILRKIEEQRIQREKEDEQRKKETEIARKKKRDEEVAAGAAAADEKAKKTTSATSTATTTVETSNEAASEATASTTTTNNSKEQTKDTKADAGKDEPRKSMSRGPGDSRRGGGNERRSVAGPGRNSKPDSERQANPLESLPQSWRRDPNDKPVSSRGPRRSSSNQDGGKSRPPRKDGKDSKESKDFKKDAPKKDATSKAPSSPTKKSTTTSEDVVDAAGFKPASSGKGSRNNNKTTPVYEKETVDVTSKNAFDLLQEDA